jgi:hypothetical protein
MVANTTVLVADATDIDELNKLYAFFPYRPASA